MDNFDNSTYAIVDKHGDSTILLYCGSEEDVDRNLPIYQGIADEVGDIHKINISGLDIESIKKNPDIIGQSVNDLGSN